MRLHSAGTEESAIQRADGDRELVPATSVTLPQLPQRGNVVHVTMGDGYPDRNHVENVNPGRDFRLIPSRIDDDAFLLAA